VLCWLADLLAVLLPRPYVCVLCQKLHQILFEVVCVVLTAVWSLYKPHITLCRCKGFGIVCMHQKPLQTRLPGSCVVSHPGFSMRCLLLNPASQLWCVSALCVCIRALWRRCLVRVVLH
jgi:hypothetical protein